MVNFGQATYIDGTFIPGAELRRNTQRDAGPGSGVIRPGDLKVTQMDVPGAGVKIAVGDALIQSRAPGAERETYGVPLTVAQNYLGDAGTGIPGTGSSVPSGGRRDMLFVEVLDPGLPTFYTPQVDWPAGQSLKLSIIQNVGATAQHVEDVPALANVTGESVAIITYPASTATITNAMISDPRRLHSPREKTVVRAFGMGETPQKLTNNTAYPGGVTWPGETLAETNFALDIPEWATQATIIMTVSGVQMNNVETLGGDAAGWFWVQVGINSDPDVRRTEQTRWDADAKAAQHRTVFRTADTITIPAGMRGAVRRFYPRGNVTSERQAPGTTYSGPRADNPFIPFPIADSGSSVDLMVVFREVKE